MRKITYTRIWLVSLMSFVLAGVSCIKEDPGMSMSEREGVPITLKVTLGTARTSDITITRADNSYSDLENLTLFIYNADGTYCEQVLLLESGDMTILSGKTGANGEQLYQITFETTSGTKNLIGVANYSTDNSGFWTGFVALRNQAEAGSLSFDALRKGLVSLRAGLNNADGDLNLPTLASSSQMLISGWNTQAVFSTSGAVSDFGERGDADLGVLLKMDRAMARIIFNIPAASTTNGAGRTVTFTPSTFRVYNVPKNSLLATTATTMTDAGKTTEYLRSALTNVGAVSGGNYSFSFYMPENVQEAGTSTEYVERDMWNGDENPGVAPENKTWTNAPQNSTFVVINGTYTEEDNGNPYYTGNVNYTVHLGDFSTGNGATGSMDNFSVERNYSYTYNMTVLGVDNIVVEAKKENGTYQQGAEGEIYDANNCVYNYQLDAHFEQVYLQYDLSNIAKSLEDDLKDDALDDAISSKLILVIQSEAMDHNSDGVVNKRGSLQPYKIYADAVRNAADPDQAAADAKSDILDGAGSNGVPTKGFDYKWIEFWPQTGTTLASYPGTPTWSLAYIKGVTDAVGNAEYLMDVYDVIVAMGKVVKKIYLNNQGGQNTISTNARAEDGITVSQVNGNYVARFTAFVNEYYYYTHPLTGEDLTTWSVLTNKIAREMVIAMSTNVSTDGNSSFSQIHSYISQLSMQTFYNSRVTNLNGFGIETYNETPLTFSYGSPSILDTEAEALDDADGRSNQIRLLGSNPGVATSTYGDWSTYINAANNGWTKTVTSEHASHKLQANAYAIQSAYSACMSRNRDLNGNRRIDDNEVRWYLASLNEYIRMGIGAGAVSNAAQLYIGDKTEMVRGTGVTDPNGYPSAYIALGSLFYTSSAPASKGVYWAVERGSYGAVHHYGGDKTIDGYYDGSALPIRCVRVLPAIGVGGNTASTVNGIVAASTVEKRRDKGQYGGYIVLKFKDRLVDDLYRQRVDGSLDPHNEDDPANSFYDGIFVDDTYLSGYYRLGDIIGYEGWGDNVTFNGTMTNPCPTGWRVPNLVELSAMNAVGGLLTDNSNYPTACCTQFSNSNVRYGFAYSTLIYCPGSKVGDVTGSTMRIRCVKDVPAGYDFENQSSPVN